MKILQQVTKILKHILTTVAVIVVYAILTPLIIVPAVAYIWWVILPIMRAIELQPQYWLTWSEIKRLSGQPTIPVLYTLAKLSGPDGQFDCQFRSQVELIRLEKFLHRQRPVTKVPAHPDEVVFYTFRLKWGGPPKRNRWSLALPRILVPQLARA